MMEDWLSCAWILLTESLLSFFFLAMDIAVCACFVSHILEGIGFSFRYVLIVSNDTFASRSFVCINLVLCIFLKVDM